MEHKKSRHFTLMIMPETSALEVRRMRISRRLLQFGVVTVAILLVASIVGAANSAYLWEQSHQNDQLRAENVALRARIENLDDQVQDLGEVVGEMKQFDAKLRALTMVSDPVRNLAIGPIGETGMVEQDAAEKEASNLRRDLLAGSSAGPAELVGTRLERVDAEARVVGKRVQELSVYLEGQRSILASTPSRRPAQGYVTSTYGMRVDPFTGLPQMHSGVDFSNNIGTRVTASGDGTVIYTGVLGAYGNIVEIDHGNGLVTKYAHLSKLEVKTGEKVNRGQVIGLMGNSGRSTGPHLHYEIRLRGVPQDPERFLLE